MDKVRHQVYIEHPDSSATPCSIRQHGESGKKVWQILVPKQLGDDDVLCIRRMPKGIQLHIEWPE